MGVDVAKVAGTLSKILKTRIESDQLVIPTLPTVAADCLSLVRNPEFSMRDLAGTMQRDPLLVVQVVRAATSAANGGNPKMSIEQAVARLGNARLRMLLVEVCAKRLFTSPNPRIDDAVAALWEHSQAVGVLARDLIATAGGMDAEAAYLAGILHDVGKPIIAAYLLDAEMQLSGRSGWISAEEWLDAVQAIHQPLAVLLCDKWKLPSLVGQIVKECGEYDMADRTSPSNYVRFANAVCKLNDIYAGRCDKDDAKTMVMLGRTLLGVDDELLDRLLGTLQDRVRIPRAGERRAAATTR